MAGQQHVEQRSWVLEVFIFSAGWRPKLQKLGFVCLRWSFHFLAWGLPPWNHRGICLFTLFQPSWCCKTKEQMLDNLFWEFYISQSAVHPQKNEYIIIYIYLYIYILFNFLVLQKMTYNQKDSSSWAQCSFHDQCLKLWCCQGDVLRQPAENRQIGPRMGPKENTSRKWNMGHHRDISQISIHRHVFSLNIYIYDTMYVCIYILIQDLYPAT